MSRTALVNADCSPSIWTTATKDDNTLPQSTWSHGESRAKCHGSRDYPNQESAKHFIIISCTHTMLVNKGKICQYTKLA
jgi:hypothetical protein